MVLRGQPVGEQGAADRWAALGARVAGAGGLRAPFFHAAIRCGMRDAQTGYNCFTTV